MNSYSPLKNNLETETAIIGGGLTGIWTAYLLAKAGRECAVFEAKQIGQGATGKTTAFITQVIDTEISSLVDMFGESQTKKIWYSGESAINQIESVIKTEKIKCDFVRCSMYSYAANDKELKALYQEKRAYDKLKFKVSLKTKSQFGFDYGVLEIPNQAKYDIEGFMQGLSKAAVRNGAKIFEDTEIKEPGKNNLLITTKGFTIKAKNVIIATYDSLGNPKETKFKKGMYKTYLLKLKAKNFNLPYAIYEDQANPYNYFRVDKKRYHDEVTLGGADHRLELKLKPSKNFNALKEYAKKIFAGVDYEVMETWTGPILEPSDGLPLIGKHQPRRYLATAFSGNGMTYAPLAGQIITDQILGKKNIYASVYNPTRKINLKALKQKALDYSGEFFHGAVKAFKKS